MTARALAREIDRRQTPRARRAASAAGLFSFTQTEGTLDVKKFLPLFSLYPRHENAIRNVFIFLDIILENG